MSVNSTGVIWIVPIFRQPDIKPNRPDIIARWRVSHDLIGDASGGTYTFSSYFQNALGFLGVHILWDLVTMNIYKPLGAAITAATVSIEPYERSSPYQYDTEFYSIGYASVGNRWEQQHPNPFKHRFSDISGLPSQINIAASANDNGVHCYCQLAGYIYDERYI